MASSHENVAAVFIDCLLAVTCLWNVFDDNGMIWVFTFILIELAVI